MKIPVDKHDRLALAHRVTMARQRAILTDAAQLLAYAEQIAADAEWRAAAPARAAVAKERKRKEAEKAVAAAAAREAERERLQLAAEKKEAERVAFVERQEAARLAKWEADAPLRAADAERKEREAIHAAEVTAYLDAQAKAIAAKERADAERLRTLAASLPVVPQSKSKSNAPRFQIMSIGTTMAEIVLGRDLGVRNWNIYGNQIDAGKRYNINNNFLLRMLDDPGLMLVEQVQR